MPRKAKISSWPASLKWNMGVIVKRQPQCQTMSWCLRWYFWTYGLPKERWKEQIHGAALFKDSGRAH
jgi:hypothetical protein